jgi:hypothetical protein
MRWDTFIALNVVFSNDEKTTEYMKFLGIHFQAVEELVRSEMMTKKGGVCMDFEKLWTDYESSYTIVQATCPLPVGIKGSKCPKCDNDALTGAIITKNADEKDPNILCRKCGYWRD